MSVALCVTAKFTRSCPLWVKSRHQRTFRQCPLYPQKRTLVERVVMSALCQKRTHAVQQLRLLLDHLIGASEQCGRHVEAERLGSLEIDTEVEMRRLLEWQVRRLGS